MAVEPLDLSKLRILPLAARRSLTRADEILVDPDSAPPPCPDPAVRAWSSAAAEAIRAARRRGAAVVLIYGAHLLRNGAARILERMMAGGWLTHLATNGAGTIHDWEYAWLGASTESVEQNVATGTFGSWHETATNIHLALMAGASTAWATAVRWGGSSSRTGPRCRIPTSWPPRSPPSPGIR